MIVCVVTWMEALRGRGKDLKADIVLVTGSDKGRTVNGGRKGRFPKLFACAERTLGAVGLKPKSLRTLTMQALTVDKESLRKWIYTQNKVDKPSKPSISKVEDVGLESRQSLATKEDEQVVLSEV